MAFQKPSSVASPDNASSPVTGRRNSNLQMASLKEQRKLEETLDTLSREMRSRMNRLDTETNEVRRQAARMFDTVRRKEHVRATSKSRAGTASSARSDVSDRTPFDTHDNDATARTRGNSASHNDARTPQPAPAAQIMGRSNSFPASIARLDQVGDIETAEQVDAAMGVDDISDECLAADAASIPVTNMPSFCGEGELEMIGEVFGSDAEEDDVGIQTNEHCDGETEGNQNSRGRRMSHGGATNHADVEENCTAPSEAGNSGASDGIVVQTPATPTGRTLLKKRRTSEIAKPVSLLRSSGGKPSRRHSSHEPPLIPSSNTNLSSVGSYHSGASGISMHRTSSVNLPPLRRVSSTELRSPSVGHSVLPPLSRASSGRLGSHHNSRGSLSYGMSPPISPSASTRSLAAGGNPSSSTTLHRRASRTESVPCIMKQTFASTPRRSISDVVGEIVHIEEMRRLSRHGSGSLHGDSANRVTRRGAWHTNQRHHHRSAIAANIHQRVAEPDPLTKTKSLGDIFEELKDCRYLRISNSEST